MHSTDIQWSAILSWGYADNILRLKSKQSEPPINFIQCSQLHQVNAGRSGEIGRSAAGFHPRCPVSARLCPPPLLKRR